MCYNSSTGRHCKGTCVVDDLSDRRPPKSRFLIPPMRAAHPTKLGRAVFFVTNYYNHKTLNGFFEVQSQLNKDYHKQKPYPRIRFLNLSEGYGFFYLYQTFCLYVKRYHRTRVGHKTQFNMQYCYIVCFCGEQIRLRTKSKNTVFMRILRGYTST